MQNINMTIWIILAVMLLFILVSIKKAVKIFKDINSEN